MNKLVDLEVTLRAPAYIRNGIYGAGEKITVPVLITAKGHTASEALELTSESEKIVAETVKELKAAKATKAPVKAASVNVKGSVVSKATKPVTSSEVPLV